MLVLTRKQQEQIQIGDNVTITILKVKGRAVRLGIEAPRQVRVVRGELPRTEEIHEPPIPAEAATEIAPACPSIVRHEKKCRRKADVHESTEPPVGPRHAVAVHRPLSSLVRNSTRTGLIPATAK